MKKYCSRRIIIEPLNHVLIFHHGETYCKGKTIYLNYHFELDSSSIIHNIYYY